ncbi:MAG: (2Fe-2S) ferredoxin domain-containing protein, partial [Eubacteriales bacterium]
AELAAIKEKMKSKVALRNGEKETVIAVSMGSCGISAGARDVLAAFVEAVDNENLTDKVSVIQTGCIGLCDVEPVVKVHTSDGADVTYIKMTAERARDVIEKHIKGGNVVTEYTMNENGGQC